MKKTVLIVLTLLCGIGTVRAADRTAADTTSTRDRLDAIEDLAGEVKEKKAKSKAHDKLFDFSNARFGFGDVLVDGVDWFNAKKNRSFDIWFTAIEMDVNATEWFSFDLGLNLKWNRLRAGDGKYLYLNTDKAVNCIDASLVKDPSIEYKKFISQVNVFSLAVPAALDFHFGKFGARLGADFVFPVSNSLRTREKYDNETHRSRYNGADLAKWYYDFFGELSYSDIGIYVRYSPVELIPGTGMSTTEIGLVLTL